ncbi:ribosome biogenesis GTP-binding protein YihA/YsxC [Thiolapillus sp.]|uniref:ribosome biogenesis GTP-binding protein YihA/YsxC n=2 Tax=Thiolapillus sp. TaxID=2017437 RepID=UPI0025E47877|nr:ribosome biogenesis GTP-binding protein YihA/YsxC [Thiolapillus sp.]
MQTDNYYRQASFLTSAAKFSQCLPDEGFEVAFAGRSNAGKSSAINVICDHRGLAKTSKTPGRTQLINFFELDEERRLVDLPGYGYAKVSVSIKKDWQGNLAIYLEKRQCLKGLVLMMDSRHPLKGFDVQMLEWAAHIGLPVHVLLTKADKLKKGPASASFHKVKSALKEMDGEFSVQLFSSLKKTGVAEAHRKLNQWLDRA